MHRTHDSDGTKTRPEVQQAPADRAPWKLLALLCLPQFMVVLDITVINVALPSIGQGLAFAPSELQWVVSIYVLATGGLMLLGRSADLLGRRRILLAGVALFTAASPSARVAHGPQLGFH